MNRLQRNIGTVTLALALIVGMASALPAFAQTLTRAPYLQSGTPNSMVLRWRTNTAVIGVVRYGTAQGSLTLQQQEATARTEHEVRLTGLSPNTRYFYAVGTATATLAGNDANHFFLTSPPVGTAKPTRIWVLGDSGTANANAQAVRNAYTNFNGTRYTDLWLMLGDNAYESGTDAEFQAAVFNMYPTFLRQSVLWPTLGNHDGAAADSATQTGPYYNIFTLPRNAEAGGIASGTEAYHSFDYGNIHFINLDSFETSRSATGPMANWLRQDLADTTQDWIIAFFHHPPYSKGSHNSDTETELVQMRRNILPILEAGGVDLVLTGHSHSYERSFLLDGHYGTSGTLTPAMKINGGSGRVDGTGAYNKAASAGEGAVYVVAGSSGQASGGSLNHPAMFISLNNLGSMILDVNGNRLDAQFLRENGTRPDHFTILKGAPAVSITAPTNGATFTAPASITIQATASDSDGTISKVEFFQGTTKLGEDLTSPYSFLWTNVAAGSYILTARATDNDNNPATSAPVNITVTGPNSPPTASITAPTNGATFTAPALITIQATASDVGGAVSKVEFFQGATLLGEDTTSPYAFTWSNVPLGNYTLTARATDNQGATTTSSVVNIVVTNVTTTVNLTVNRTFDSKNGKFYFTGGPDGADSMNDLNTTAEEYKVELESGATFWWEAMYQDPAVGSGNPTQVIVTLHYRAETTWAGTFRAEYRNGTTVLASVNLPVNSTNDPVMGKGQKGVHQWNVSSVVTTAADLAAGKIRFLNSSTNGKKVWVTYSVTSATLVGGNAAP